MENNIYLSRSEASHFLCDRGLSVAVGTLAKYACVGGGPRFVKFGRKPLYTKQSLEEWIAEKLSAEIASTSELTNDTTVNHG
jgi:hypothetical protein